MQPFALQVDNFKNSKSRVLQQIYGPWFVLVIHAIFMQTMILRMEF
jgi:hypothetical protein